MWSMFLLIRLTRTKYFSSIPHMSLTRLSKVALSRVAENLKGDSCIVCYKGEHRRQTQPDFRRRHDMAMMSTTKIIFQGCDPLDWFSSQGHACIWPYWAQLSNSNLSPIPGAISPPKAHLHMPRGAQQDDGMWNTTCRLRGRDTLSGSFLGLFQESLNPIVKGKPIKISQGKRLSDSFL